MDPKPLADYLNSKFNSMYQAYKSLDIFNNEDVSQHGFEVALRNVGLSQYNSEFLRITNGKTSMRLADLVAYLRNGEPLPFTSLSNS